MLGGHVVSVYHLDPVHTRGVATRVRRMHDVEHAALDVDLHVAVCEVLDDGLVQVRVRRALAHAQHGRLGAHGEELEDGEHAARGDVVAVDEAEGIGDGVPQALDGAAAAARPFEPLGEGDPIQFAHALHAAVKVEERLHDRAGDRVAERERVRDLVADAELRRSGEGLEAVEGRADPAHPEIELADLAALVDEEVAVILEAQPRFVGANPLHDPEEVVVAAEEDVKTHLDVVAVLVQPRGDLATDEAARLEHLDVVARL
mmetsp:Transcript_15467/g.39248  ORF Transcript_15467/g.39248 Transcript_15467/m.39248 type:complete len:260 (-) Transcript_15467:259-1038(-)